MSTIESEPQVADPSPRHVLLTLVPGFAIAAVMLTVLVLSWWKSPAVVELAAILDQDIPPARSQQLTAFQNRLKTNDLLAADPDVALLLLRRTERLLARRMPREEQFARQQLVLPPEAVELERRKLLGDREYLQDLLNTLPLTMLPVGLTLLNDLARKQPAIEPKLLVEQRRTALQALGDLGGSAERCLAMAPEYAEELIAQLEARNSPGAMIAAAYLRNLRASKSDMLGIEATLSACATDDDPGIRQAAAFCARHWAGTPAQNAEVEAFLVPLQDDDGRGPDAEMKSFAALKIRSQAALSLAWRGSKKVSLDRLEQALNPGFLRATRGVDETFLLDLVLSALNATQRLHQKNPELDLSSLKPAINRLTESTNTTLKSLAESTLKAVDKP